MKSFLLLAAGSPSASPKIGFRARYLSGNVLQHQHHQQQQEQQEQRMDIGTLICRAPRHVIFDSFFYQCHHMHPLTHSWEGW